MEINSIEKETIGLCICVESLNNMVNHALLDVRKSSRTIGEAEVYFKDFIHRSLFVIRFLDFAKEAGDSKLTGVSGSCINVLSETCQSKSFNKEVTDLQKALNELVNWLEFKAPLKLCLPTLDIEAKIEVSRMDFLKISGNHSKHNISRLTGVSKEIHKILTEHDYVVPLELIPLALEDFQEHLDENYFIYYGTWMAQLLNDVRWGIQAYLTPIYISCHKRANDGFSYKYEYPEGLENELSKQWFWRLMNHVRASPYLEKFTAPDSFTSQSSLEWDME
ncbi:hypothetical protein [Kordiimonas sp.]|uniref:hypothetical protein n=1 Tax=Kordiimonas sp. TaxID=1970157 RepID=UPI003B51F542